jgi:hypothetical protein
MTVYTASVARSRFVGTLPTHKPSQEARSNLIHSASQLSLEHQILPAEQQTKDNEVINKHHLAP